MSKLPIEQFLKEAFKRNKSAQIHKEVYKRAEELIRRCYAENIFIVFTDGLRTNVDQAVLYGKGRSSYIYNGKQYGDAKAKKVTNAKPGSSFHNYGLALDFVTCDGYGKNIDWNVGPKWRRAAAIAKELGFTWGGDWKSFVDYPHIEYNGGLTISQVASGKFPTFKPFTSIANSKPSTVEDKSVNDRARKLIRKAVKDGVFTSKHEDVDKYTQDQLLHYIVTYAERLNN